MRRLLAAFCAACLSTSFAHQGFAGTTPSHMPKTQETRVMFPAEAEREPEAGKIDRKKTGTSKKRAAASQKVVRTSKLKTFDRTSGYPKAEKPEVSASSGYSGLIKSYASAYGVPVGLAHAVVRIESNFNPKARGRAGEIGLMQIKPATARMMGYSGGAQGLYDPETNIKFGMKYLAMAHKLGGGTVCGTILKYNAGHGAKRMNPTSKRYCGKVQSIMN